jgi:hypothetical protein
MLLAFIGGRAIAIPPKPRSAAPTLPLWIRPLRPEPYWLIFACAMPKVCRILLGASSGWSKVAQCTMEDRGQRKARSGAEG